MPSPGPLGSRPPLPVGAGVRPPRAGSSTAPRSPALLDRPAGGEKPRAPGRLESFSVEAILARPDPRAPAVSQLSGSAGTFQGLWTAPSQCPVPVLPWVCPAPWLPAYLSMSLYPLYPQQPVQGLRLAHFCGLQGVGDTDLELAYRPGLRSSPDWVPTKDLPDTERYQKRVRTMFNLEQLEELEKVFAKQHNLVGKKRAQLAARLNLTENQVRVWFQNRRVKYQKQQKVRLPAASAEAASLDEPSSSSNASIQSDDFESGVDS
ncbi:homeobox protein notochord [Otolemur garnettii]|uniref:Notochord homeobox n=1 Tax=Otolemur garnettii TaxID=30611 RepID=H0XKA9_OTOGA|nr:homeobox protein notochord [Otolemur garnettii]